MEAFFTPFFDEVQRLELILRDHILLATGLFYEAFISKLSS